MRRRRQAADEGGGVARVERSGMGFELRRAGAAWNNRLLAVELVAELAVVIDALQGIGHDMVCQRRLPDEEQYGDGQGHE
ncbi:MAG: hypothetical protein R3270_01870 [Gammaproteobacteria bacterium]|nr:hypothetical protein [Gammaproteobacteria bacterium]